MRISLADGKNTITLDTTEGTLPADPARIQRLARMIANALGTDLLATSAAMPMRNEKPPVLQYVEEEDAA